MFDRKPCPRAAPSTARSTAPSTAQAPAPRPPAKEAPLNPRYLQWALSPSAVGSSRALARPAPESSSAPSSTPLGAVPEADSGTATETAPSGGRPLDRASLGFFEPRLGHALGGVRVHTGATASASAAALGARAYTIGDHVVLGAGAPPLATARGRSLLGHELAHVIQQRQGGGATAAGAREEDPAAEAEASRVARRVALGDHAAVTRGAAAGAVQRSPLSDQFNDVWMDPVDTLNRRRVFDWLRGLSDAERAAALTDTDLHVALSSATLGRDDMWMVGNLLQYGSEVRWPSDQIAERHRRMSTGWDPEHSELSLLDRAATTAPGLIEGDLNLPSPGSGSVGGPMGMSTGLPAAVVPGRRALAPSPVHAYFFPGQSDERALVIGGVHGAEQSGIEVVERLRDRLAAATTPPYYTTILVPVLFPDDRAYDQAVRQADPATRGTDLANEDGGRYVRLVSRRGRVTFVEPNRNYPLPGQSLSSADTHGLTDPATGDPLSGPRVIATMLPETRMLLALIDRFRPSRIVSAHAHLPSSRRGDGPGIFVDPRGGDPARGVASFDRPMRTPRGGGAAVEDPTLPHVTRTAEGRADDALATRMGDYAASLGVHLPGNRRGVAGEVPTVHYSASHPTGTSLGDWAPVAIAERLPGGAPSPESRPAMTIITVEVERYFPSAEDPTGAMASQVEGLADTIENVFLR